MACGMYKFIKSFKYDKTSPKLVASSRSDTVMYTGGTIRPIVAGSVAKVDAIGFHDGKVHSVGSLNRVKSKMDSLKIKYATVKLSDGQTLLPGLIEPHVHFVPSAITMAWSDFGPYDGQDMRAPYNIDWLKQALASAKSALDSSGDLKKGAWILGTGLDPSLMPFNLSTVRPSGLNKLITFEADTIDCLEPSTPVYVISASGHTGYVNTPAIQLIYDANPDIKQSYPTFAEYREHVNAAGGMQEFEEMLFAVKAIPTFQFEIASIFEHLDSFVDTALSRGATLIYDATASDDTIKAVDQYLKVHPNKIRVGYATMIESLAAAENLPEYKPLTKIFKNNYAGCVKLVSDGSNQGLTGYQSDTYRCEPAGNVGAFNFPPFSQPKEMTPDSEFTKMVQTIVDKGWPIMCHANGDMAIKLTLDAFKIALKGESGIPKRHRIEHCSLVDKETLERMSDLGISPSFLVGHIGYWGYTFKNAIFEEKSNILGVCQSALQKGMKISFHSDCTVSPMGPLRMMEQAITRIMEEDPEKNVLNVSERVTPEQALKVATNNGAWQCQVDEFVGSLEEGKLADYVILAEDPITRGKLNPVGMRDIPVLETWVNGVCRFKK